MSWPSDLHRFELGSKSGTGYNGRCGPRRQVLVEAVGGMVSRTPLTPLLVVPTLDLRLILEPLLRTHGHQLVATRFHPNDVPASSEAQDQDKEKREGNHHALLFRQPTAFRVGRFSITAAVIMGDVFCVRACADIIGSDGIGGIRCAYHSRLVGCL